MFGMLPPVLVDTVLEENDGEKAGFMTEVFVEEGGLVHGKMAFQHFVRLGRGMFDRILPGEQRSIPGAIPKLEAAGRQIVFAHDLPRKRPQELCPARTSSEVPLVPEPQSRSSFSAS